MIWLEEPLCSLQMTRVLSHVEFHRFDEWIICRTTRESALHVAREGGRLSSQVLTHAQLLFSSEDSACDGVRQHACPLSQGIFCFYWLLFFGLWSPHKIEKSKTGEGEGWWWWWSVSEQTDEWRMKGGGGEEKPNQVRSRKITAWRWSRQHSQLCVTLLNKLFRLLHFIKGSERAHDLIHYSLILMLFFFLSFFFFCRERSRETVHYIKTWPSENLHFQVISLLILTKEQQHWRSGDVRLMAKHLELLCTAIKKQNKKKT